MKNKLKEIYMYILGGIIIVLTFFVVGILMFVEVPSNNSDVFYMSIGQILTGMLAVVFYFYGSSKSSQDKTNLLSNKSDKDE